MLAVLSFVISLTALFFNGSLYRHFKRFLIGPDRSTRRLNSRGFNLFHLHCSLLKLLKFFGRLADFQLGLKAVSEAKVTLYLAVVNFSER